MSGVACQGQDSAQQDVKGLVIPLLPPRSLITCQAVCCEACFLQEAKQQDSRSLVMQLGP